MNKKKKNDNEIVISKMAVVNLVAQSLKGKILFKSKIDTAKELLKNNKDFIPLASDK